MTRQIHSPLHQDPLSVGCGRHKHHSPHMSDITWLKVCVWLTLLDSEIQTRNIRGLLPVGKRKGERRCHAISTNVSPGTLEWQTLRVTVHQEKMLLFWRHALGYTHKCMFLHAHLACFSMPNVVFSSASLTRRIFCYLMLSSLTRMVHLPDLRPFIKSLSVMITLYFLHCFQWLGCLPGGFSPADRIHEHRR